MTAYTHGLVLGKFFPLHAGHSQLIDTALDQCEQVTVQLLAAHDEEIPLDVRAAWIRAAHPEVELKTAYDDVPTDFESDEIWSLHMRIIGRLLDSPVDAVFTSDDYGAELARRLGASWVQVDPGRRQVPVSGTAVRADPASYWWALSPAVRSWYAARVVVLGAESTGTTTLSLALADHLGAAWVEEYGRRYSAEDRPGGLEPSWTSDEFTLIARRQIELEEEALRQTSVPLVVCDTDVLATTVWHERYVGGRCEDVVSLAAARPPALYILTGCEIPFVQDGLRDGEHVREWMHDRFREVLSAQPVPWVEVSGSQEERLATAVRYVEDIPGIGGCAPRRFRPVRTRGADIVTSAVN